MKNVDISTNICEDIEMFNIPLVLWPGGILEEKFHNIQSFLNQILYLGGAMLLTGSRGEEAIRAFILYHTHRH